MPKIYNNRNWLKNKIKLIMMLIIMLIITIIMISLQTATLMRYKLLFNINLKRNFSIFYIKKFYLLKNIILIKFYIKVN